MQVRKIGVSRACKHAGLDHSLHVGFWPVKSEPTEQIVCCRTIVVAPEDSDIEENRTSFLEYE